MAPLWLVSMLVVSFAASALAILPVPEDPEPAPEVPEPWIKCGNDETLQKYPFHEGGIRLRGGLVFTISRPVMRPRILTTDLYSSQLPFPDINFFDAMRELDAQQSLGEGEVHPIFKVLPMRRFTELKDFQLATNEIPTFQERYPAESEEPPADSEEAVDGREDELMGAGDVVTDVSTGKGRSSSYQDEEHKNFFVDFTRQGVVSDIPANHGTDLEQMPNNEDAYLQTPLALGIGPPKPADVDGALEFPLTLVKASVTPEDDSLHFHPGISDAVEVVRSARTFSVVGAIVVGLSFGLVFASLLSCTASLLHRGAPQDSSFILVTAPEHQTPLLQVYEEEYSQQASSGAVSTQPSHQSKASTV